MSTDPYAELGRGYARRRRPDPRIHAHVAAAVGEARSVVNVGAGPGSYEPDATVVAVEPSPTMYRQRPAGAAPVVRAVAGALPLADGAAEVGLAILTVHHWPDPDRGIDELARVSRRQVVLTWDTAVLNEVWLTRDYLPEIRDLESRVHTVDEIVASLRRHHDRIEIRPVPVPADCTDGFLAAYWRRPRAYLDPAVRAAASGLARLPSDVVDAAVARLAADLDDGSWHRAHADLLDRDELDAGYRLVLAG